MILHERFLAADVVLFISSIGCQRETSDSWFESPMVLQTKAPFVTPAVPVTRAGPAEQIWLRLTLELGTRFPVIKTVTQNLIQESGHTKATAIARLELRMVVRVEETCDSDVLLSVCLPGQLCSGRPRLPDGLIHRCCGAGSLRCDSPAS